MRLYICSSCHQHFMGKTCEHCNTTSKPTMPKMAGLALILGLGLAACGEKDEDSGDDTGSEETEEPADEPAAEPDVAALYGVEETD